MEKYALYIIETIVVIVVYFALKYVTRKSVNKVAEASSKSELRVKIVGKVINLILVSISSLFIIMIWGVKQSDLVLFFTSILTVIGIAFFAQWSIISNITSAFIIFFNHPAKIGDEIEVFDNDYPVKGRVADIGVFFITIQSNDGATMTIPSNVFIQKMIVKKDTADAALKNETKHSDNPPLT